MSALVPFVLLAALVAGLEAWFTRGSGIYNPHESEVSVGLVAGRMAAMVIFLPVTAFVYDFSYRHRIFDLAAGISGSVLLLLLSDFLYYVFHRLSHRLRWLWASHAAHHTASRLNILVGFRHGWTDFFSGVWLIAAALGLLGATAQTLQIYFLITLVLPFWNHSEWIGRCGPLEWIFNTPSHHRVHHSRDANQMNANYGEVLIIWDRLFGTFSAEGPKRVTIFGVRDMPPPDAGPVAIAFGEWQAMFRDCLQFRR